VLYAWVEASAGKGGFFRSSDRGESWDKRSGYVSTSPQYYQEIIPDPKRIDRVYAMDTLMKVTEDAGQDLGPAVSRRASTSTTTRCGSTPPTTTT
jgi:hypothetical protein